MPRPKTTIKAGDLHKTIENEVRKAFLIPAEFLPAVPMVIEDVLTSGRFLRLARSVSSKLPPKAQALVDKVRARQHVIRQATDDFKIKRTDLYHRITSFALARKQALEKNEKRAMIRRFFEDWNVFSYQRGLNGKLMKLSPLKLNLNRKIKNTPHGRFAYVDDMQDGQLVEFLTAYLGVQVTATDISKARTLPAHKSSR